SSDVCSSDLQGVAEPFNELGAESLRLVGAERRANSIERIELPEQQPRHLARGLIQEMPDKTGARAHSPVIRHSFGSDFVHSACPVPTSAKRRLCDFTTSRG